MVKIIVNYVDHLTPHCWSIGITGALLVTLLITPLTDAMKRLFSHMITSRRDEYTAMNCLNWYDIRTQWPIQCNKKVGDQGVRRFGRASSNSIVLESGLGVEGAVSTTKTRYNNNNNVMRVPNIKLPAHWLLIDFFLWAWRCRPAALARSGHRMGGHQGRGMGGWETLHYQGDDEQITRVYYILWFHSDSPTAERK